MPLKADEPAPLTTNPCAPPAPAVAVGSGVGVGVAVGSGVGVGVAVGSGVGVGVAVGSGVGVGVAVGGIGVAVGVGVGVGVAVGSGVGVAVAVGVGVIDSVTVMLSVPTSPESSFVYVTTTYWPEVTESVPLAVCVPERTDSVVTVPGIAPPGVCCAGEPVVR